MDGLVNAIIGHLHYAGLFILLILGGVGFPVPEDLVLLTCGALVAAGALDPLPSLLVVYSGMLASDFLLYNLGNRYGSHVIEKTRFRRLLPPGRLDAMKRKFDRWGVLVIMVGRHLAGLRAQIFLAAGIAGMPRLKFVAADAVSALITLSIMAGLGYKGAESARALSLGAARFTHIAIAAAVILLASYTAYSYFRRWRAEGPR